ncbi:MAG: endopeptidase La, partial [Planctomycetes bacterium]|nr:endopeptidase La [Planctomycetota bacterium]
ISVSSAGGMLLFPRVVLPIVVGRDRSVRAVQAAVQAERPIGILLQKDEDELAPGPDGLHSIGTIANIVRYITAPDGSHHVIAQGEARFRILSYVQVEPYLVARVERIEEVEQQGPEIEARFLSLKARAHEALALLPQKPEDLDQAIENAGSPSGLTDLVATFMDIPVKEKQEILETVALVPRMDMVLEKLAHLVEVLTLSQEIRQKTQGKMEKAQREYYLREQLRQIEKELGEGASVELADLAVAIDKSKMTSEVKKEARRELARLQRMPEGAAEYGMLRGYLEALVELPWGKTTKDKIDIKQARAILDEDHFGLEKIKRRIVEFLAVKKLAPEGKSPILCFVGPPGVGKTSLGRSIARAMGRKFVRMSLGGVHDESEIRGHRRTYVGAMPGSVMQHLRKCGVANPVFMLDEMDKLGRSMHGDPSSALLEVLDPEQNKAFVDHYLNVPFDLSKALFIATANVLDSIPGPLRDRCEVIELAGYTQEEKLQIAKRYLVARQREANGLAAEQFAISDAAIVEIIRSYTREAGCRSLERELGTVGRHAATRIASDEAASVSIDAPDLRAILGPVRFENELALRTSQPGVATGLAWTPTGGEILFIEATKMPGKGELILTGQLGDVMKESARAAISLVKTNAVALGIDPAVFEKSDIHIHVPAGAIPKDGPSAGVALTTALVSLLTGKTIKSDLAMTGEISLRGLVLPVGGIKEKVLAARRAGIKTVCLPARNEKDFEDVPEDTQKAMRFLWLSDIDQVLREALGIRELKLKPSPETPASTGRISASAEAGQGSRPPSAGR